MNKPTNSAKDAYVVTVDMGYGHQRAVYPLSDIAACPIGWDGGKRGSITANNYPGIPASDKRIWDGGRSLYERISRMKHVPLVGPLIFGVMDYIQRIQPFYPHRDLRKATLQLKQTYGLVKKGWGKHLIDELNKKPLPLVTSFFTTAFFAQEHGYKGEIYCICTDTDVSRTWVDLEPEKTRITYLAPNPRVKERLQLYGVPKEKIILTGFPLPKENIGDDGTILKEALGKRLSHLDPKRHYRNKYQDTLNRYLGIPFSTVEDSGPLTITFAVGGAGAQREIGATILQSLHEHIRSGRIRLNLVAGSRNDVYTYYVDRLKQLKLEEQLGTGVRIIYHEQKNEYFKLFNNELNTTDILWTKPSELSFYAGLGLPIIMAPAVGSQEDYNRAWLLAIGAGIDQEDPRYANEWLFDWLESGWLAEAAMEGFMDAPSAGAYRVERVVFEGLREDIEDNQLM